MTSNKKIATGFFIGAFLGTVAGILFAPKKGSKTRADIAYKANEIGASVKKNYEMAKEKIGLKNLNKEQVLVEN